ncbi:hypothetical protein AB0H76_14285 [Nocardia sp. NPDC050712]|uniref:hypothetical protein n=1 Tax=Nocardia sp. NPDC050712 TaxID=3155518 RepID=UPI003406CED5
MQTTGRPTIVPTQVPGESGITEMTLPLSRLHVQWRASDGHFIVQHPDDMPTPDGDDDELLWRPWLGRNDMVVATSGPPQPPEQMWWAVWGEDVGEPVDVQVGGHYHPTIQVLGKLWFTEWTGCEQSALVSTATRVSEIHFAPPAPTTPLPADVAASGWRHIETPASFRDISLTTPMTPAAAS